MKVAAMIMLWVAFALGGMGLLLDYKQTPGALAAARAAWPASSRISRDAERPTLVMIVHPRCPCSRASIAELARLLTRISTRVRPYVLVVLPKGVDDDWARSDLVTSARAIEGVSVELDRGGVEAQRFGSFTSGQTYLYSSAGELLFSGGLTPSRGHHGDSAGSAEIERLVNGGTKLVGAPATSNVYGCELHDSNRGADER